jgi:hypothetical protein
MSSPSARAPAKPPEQGAVGQKQKADWQTDAKAEIRAPGVRIPVSDLRKVLAARFTYSRCWVDLDLQPTLEVPKY